jgi:hypothetical protein
MVHKIISRMPEVRDVFWKCFVNCAQANPASVRYIVMLMAMYLHLGPFSKYIIAAIDRRLAEEDAAPRSVTHVAERQPAAAAVM